MSRRLQLAKYGARLLWLGYALTALWAIAVRIALAHYPPGAPRIVLLRPFAFGAGLIVANAIALVLALRIRRDYAGEALSKAWLLVAWGAGFAVLRYVLLGATVVGLGGGLGRGPFAAMAQAVNVLSLVLLLAGLIRMRSAFAALGLGRLRRTDWLSIAFAIAITAVSIPLLLSVPSLGPGSLQGPLIRSLRLLDPLLAGVFAVVAVVLNRLRADMQGGPLAVSLRYVVVFVAVRLLGQLVPLLPVGDNLWILPPFVAASLASDWLFTLVVFHRWSVTVRAEELAERY